ncbi:uncharacterized protein LOC143694681 [Agelaius phoeniceus]|uniref:uncharacterized protein LOC143694681 n=1 Tax=Agelaius phoeniceus TaxID=39638 RepID=UPI004054EC36
MWATIMSSSRTAEPALQLLLDVLSAWPVSSVSTSDGDDAGVFALAATVALWRVFNLAWRSPVVLEYFPSLFLSLLFQAYISMQEMPEEVETFWKGCQEQHGLSAKPNSFALQTLKALLCQMRYEHAVLSMERKRAWDTLLRADTHHCAVLDCLDLSQCGEKVLEILTRHLQSESRQMRRVALRGLVGLTSMDPSMYSLTESLGKLLWDRDEDIVEMSLVVLSFLPLQKDLAIASPMALQLAEALWHLFDNDKSLVRLLSIGLFQDVITLVVAKGEKALKKHVSQSLLPLFFHCHNENGRVAQRFRKFLRIQRRETSTSAAEGPAQPDSGLTQFQASRETLIRVAEFLKRRKLVQLLKKQPPLRVDECLPKPQHREALRRRCERDAGGSVVGRWES